MRGVLRLTPASVAANRRASRAGLTLVEVLMSMLVTGIGVLSVIVLLPLSFVRAVQATNLTNGTILRYNAESALDVNPRLLLRWQPNQVYAVGDTIVPKNLVPPVALKVTTAGTSGLVEPGWAPAGTTNDGAGTLVWTAQLAGAYTSPILPLGSQYPPCFVIDPLGWNALGAPLQTNFGNNGAGGIDANAALRFNGELATPGLAVQQVTLPDSWVEQARGPVTAFTPTSATLSGPDLAGVGYSTPAAPAAAYPIPVMSRTVLIDSTGKVSQTRIITGTTPATGIVSWTDPLTGTFSPVSARVETQDTRYTWILTVRPSSAGGTSNVTVTVFFNRPLVADDEQVYQASGSDGVLTPFTVTYPAGKKPFVKKGGFLFDCYFGRWYRITNIANDTGSQMQVYVDSPRPQTDVITNLNFGVVCMRGVVDQFPIPPK
ncbi:MAG TPA: hypothetical protein VGP63_08840 [Planctomycetaceae bacterium]|jgi:hypothetical protein|nr:hypothetical protein [Planctomycetaceae bacterium]